MHRRETRWSRWILFEQCLSKVVQELFIVQELYMFCTRVVQELEGFYETKIKAHRKADAEHFQTEHTQIVWSD